MMSDLEAPPRGVSCNKCTRTMEPVLSGKRCSIEMCNAVAILGCKSVGCDFHLCKKHREDRKAVRQVSLQLSAETTTLRNPDGHDLPGNESRTDSGAFGSAAMRQRSSFVSDAERTELRRFGQKALKDLEPSPPHSPLSLSFLPVASSPFSASPSLSCPPPSPSPCSPAPSPSVLTAPPVPSPPLTVVPVPFPLPFPLPTLGQLKGLVGAWMIPVLVAAVAIMWDTFKA